MVSRSLVLAKIATVATSNKNRSPIAIASTKMAKPKVLCARSNLAARVGRKMSAVIF
jgi:hypothetical protein